MSLYKQKNYLESNVLTQTCVSNQEFVSGARAIVSTNCVLTRGVHGTIVCSKRAFIFICHEITNTKMKQSYTSVSNQARELADP